MIRRRASVAAALIVLLTAVLMAGPISADEGDRIVFASDRSGNFEIYVMNADGTGPVNLTNNAAQDFFPNWSPDGERIVFARGSGSLRELYVMNANGTNQTRLTFNTVADVQPAWSPNGKQLAVSRGFGGVVNDQIKFAEIFVLNAGGAGLRQVTRVTSSRPYSASVGHPVWAPDGRRLVFEVHNSRTGDPAGRRALFVINADGSEQRQLTPWSLNGSDPDWSPAGKLILFRSVPGREQHGNLYTVNADGGDLKQLTRYPSPRAVFSGSFSPDGKRITFSRFTSRGPGVFVMRANGTGVRQVSERGYDVEADWGPIR